MARTLLTVMAAVALCLACADPTVAAPSEASPVATTTGPQESRLDSIPGTWWAYIREGNDGPYERLEMEVIRKTPEEIAEYEQAWGNRNSSRIETYHHSDSINWQNVSFHGEFKFERLINSYTFLIEALDDPSYIRIINLDGRIELRRLKFTEGKLVFRDVSGIGNEYNFYRNLPDLATYARCESFDSFDASDAFDASSLVGTWTAIRRLRGFLFTLRVTRKTAEEVSAYRDDLRNTTVGETDIDWTKVQLAAELFSVDDFRALGLIEFLDKPGSIRVIPLKETWDSFGTREVDNWFTSQNLLIKKDDGFLAVKNCDNPWQMGYFSRRPQVRTRKMPWKPKSGRGG